MKINDLAKKFEESMMADKKYMEDLVNKIMILHMFKNIYEKY